MKWQLTGFDENDNLVDSYIIPEDWWVLLEVLDIPHPDLLTEDNWGEWPVSEVQARAIARVALDDIGLPMYVDWYVGAVE